MVVTRRRFATAIAVIGSSRLILHAARHIAEVRNTFAINARWSTTWNITAMTPGRLNGFFPYSKKLN
jgi:hypothetical protein